MTLPLSINAQSSENWFLPKHKIAFLFGMHTFDAVCKKTAKGLEQAMSNLPQAKEDCD